MKIVNTPGRVLAWLCLASAALLGGCGGGGGGGSSGPPPGAFTLSADSATFSALQSDAPPAAQDITINLTGSGTAVVGVAYANGQTQPAWLGIGLTGSGSRFTLRLSVQSTALAPGAYTSTFTVGTADANSNILARRDVTVTYTVTGRVSISAPPYLGLFRYGGSRTTDAVDVAVRGNGRTWSVQSDSAWLRVPAGNQTGDATVRATIDTSALAPGNYQGRLTVTDTAVANNTATLQFAVDVSAPTLTLTQGPVLLGGTDGKASAPAALTLQLDTEQAVHPYTVTLTTATGTWLQASSTSGTVGSTPVQLQFTGDRTGLRGGTYTGEIRVSATVGALSFTETRAVTFNVEAQRLVVEAAGVGLLAAPGRSVLTRGVRIYDSLGRTGVPWTATSSAPWLAATASGTTGGAPLTLTADPAGLAADTTHFATVTVRSGDATVENEQTIRVGLNVRSTASTTASVTAQGRFIAGSPVEPIVFVNDGAGTITGYDVHSATAVRTFANAVTNPGAMTVGPDGQRLYVYDRTNLEIVELDAVTGARLRTYASGTRSGTIPYGGGLGFVRPAGYWLLVTPSARVYDVADGTSLVDPLFAAPVFSQSLAASPDQSVLTTDFGGLYRVVRSALDGGRFTATVIASTGTVAGREGQACIASDNDRVYTAAGAPYEFPGYSIAQQRVVQVLPGTNYPNSMLCLWNGVVVGGVDGYYSATDVWVYYGPTGQQLALLSSSLTTDQRSLVERGLAASADGTRIVSLTLSTPGAQLGQEIRFQALPPPP